MKRIVVVGSVNMDLVLGCAVLPLAGQTVHGGELRTLPGGKGANQAVAAARLGAHVSFVGCVGDDAFGVEASAALQAEGIDLRHLHALPGVRTGVAMILVDAQGRNSIALSAGANGALMVEHVRGASALLRDAAMLVCQLETPMEAVREAIAIAAAAGVPVLLNPAPASPLPDDLLGQVDWLVPNETEAALLAGLAADAAFDAAEVAQALRSRGARGVIVTLGERGALLCHRDGTRAFEARAARAVDTTGAGDTFVGAFAAALARGATVPEAIELAQKAAALSVTRPGAMGAMPTLQELDADD